MENKTRVCTKCKRELPATAEYFNYCNKVKDGCEARCKDCRREEGRDYKANNKSKIRAYNLKYSKEHRSQDVLKQRKYREKHKELCKNRAKKWRDANKEKEKLHNKEYYKKNSESLKDRAKTYRDNNKEKIKILMEQWRKENKEIIIEYRTKYSQANNERLAMLSKKWQKENPEACRINNQKRRSKKKELESTLTLEQWEQMKKDFNYCCAYCGKKRKLTHEHFIALSNNGEYTHNNIVPVCVSCNASKGNKSFWEWFPTYRYYSKKRESFVLKYLNYDGEIQQLSLPIIV